MGVLESNCWLCPHYRASMGTTYQPRIHHGNASIDTTGPEITHAAMGELRKACGDQDDFDDAAANLGGVFAAWYAILTDASKEQLRIAVASDLP